MFKIKSFIFVIIVITIFSGCLSSSYNLGLNNIDKNELLKEIGDNKLLIANLLFDINSIQESPKSSRGAKKYKKYFLNDSICPSIGYFNIIKNDILNKYEKCELKEINNISFFNCTSHYNIIEFLEANANKLDMNKKCFDKIYNSFNTKSNNLNVIDAKNKFNKRKFLYNESGYNINGYDKEGYDKYLYDVEGNHKFMLGSK